MNYSLYQVKLEFRRDFAFMGLQERQKLHGPDLNLSVYHVTYEGTLPFGDEKEILHTLYEMFNMRHPKDFHSYSLSSGDLVQFDGQFWYCDSIGWTQVYPL
ncbi:YodL domain-containing protein [Alicyclobacillus tolerans]|uniref:YodL domain-containing protein n=1 Tax=Alicyclobacillus tolerans TaxID=90970 RepID=UPI001F171853|nr:YodL domain-containing protein [Alicyclobacillus tolerans]MCF8568157.1 YodL domain-containing protein [Alicyclobacillus tolerans]